jgi:hypothetical protein
VRGGGGGGQGIGGFVLRERGGFVFEVINSSSKTVKVNYSGQELTDEVRCTAERTALLRLRPAPGTTILKRTQKRCPPP